MRRQFPHTDPRFDCGREFAVQLDADDPLAGFRSRFFLPEKTIYFDGNSLGLMPKSAETIVRRVMDEWRERAISGWLDGENRWINCSERLGRQMAALVGAEPGEVIAAGTTTLNLHALVSTFYRPQGLRTKILGDELTFPSDIYALRGQVELKGFDPDTHLLFVRSTDGRFLEESAIIDMMAPEVSVAVLPSVLYRSGQLLDVERLTRVAHDKGIVIGFDCSHSVGVVPHELSEWDVDFAFWSGYKYLNGGPGSPAFLFVNRRHFHRRPGLPGWFGFKKDKQFDMLVAFDHERSAAGWQMSTPAILGAAPLEASLAILAEASIPAIREKSVRMTSYLMFLIDELLPSTRYGFSVGTPREATARGGHVALEHRHLARQVFEALARCDVVVDFRPPDVIRVCPTPLYNTYGEIWEVVQRLRSIVEPMVT